MSDSVLVILLPLPPSDNQCHRSGQYGRYPTTAYKTWLDLSAPLLRVALGQRPIDTTEWWEVNLGVWNKPRGYDVQNLGKAVLDLLSGAQVDGKGKIVKPGALYDDDKRVKRLTIDLMGTHDIDPRIILSASTTTPPVKWRKPSRQNARKQAPAPSTRVSGVG